MVTLMFSLRALRLRANTGWAGPRDTKVPFVDDAPPQAQTGDRRHSGMDDVTGAAWPWSKSSQHGSDAGWQR
jgi:hypothetical protein